MQNNGRKIIQIVCQYEIHPFKHRFQTASHLIYVVALKGLFNVKEWRSRSDSKTLIAELSTYILTYTIYF